MLNKKKKRKARPQGPPKVKKTRASQYSASPATRKKLSTAAKRRRRAPKGGKNAGSFLAGLQQSGARHHVEEPDTEKWAGLGGVYESEKSRKGGSGAKRPRESQDLFAKSRSNMTPEQEAKAVYTEEYNRAKKKLKKDFPQGPKHKWEEAAHDQAVSAADTVFQRRLGRHADVDELDTGRVARKVDQELAAQHFAKRDAEANWREPGRYRTNTPKSPVAFVKGLPEPHRKEVEQMMEDPNSPFNKGTIESPDEVLSKGAKSYAARRRRDQYVSELQRGASHEEALITIQRPPGRALGTKVKKEGGTVRGVPIGEVTGKDRAGRKSKTQSGAPTAQEFGVGIRAPKVPGRGRLREKFGENVSDKELIKIEQEVRQTIADEMLENHAWAHETKAAKLKGSGEPDTPDRVTFFTTSLGYPAVTVPSDSLVGQYIINKRKRVLKSEGLATRQQLRGKFPEVVRDRHIVEASTGVSLGAEGKAGIYQETGIRKGKKRWGNIGKSTPVGAAVLTDSTGAPIYDKQGNVRYTEGATREFDFRTPGELGLRVFIG